MKFLGREGEDLIFQLGKKEKMLLHEILKLYPLIPASHLKVSKGVNRQTKASQELIEQALAEKRKENQTALAAFFQDKDRFIEDKAGYRFSLPLTAREWFLQVLNDIRVGSWLVLGCPETLNLKLLGMKEQNTRYLWAMEFCGYMQSILLDADSSRG